MPNTYSQIYLQFVFAVKHREALIAKVYKEELHKYTTKLVQNRKAKMLAINCMPDHAHIFVGYHPSVLISDFVKEIKIETHSFLEGNKGIKKFEWQTGYGVFSYSRSDISKVCEYIYDQENHHKKNETFKNEYIRFLIEHEIEYNERYLFDWI